MKKLIIAVLTICVLFSNTNYIVKATENETITEETEIKLGEQGGYLNANFHTTKNLNAQRKFNYGFEGKSGKGFAAEQANNLNDIYHGKNAKIVGNDNMANGADRRIINRDGTVTQIQTKYHSTARSSIGDAFDLTTGKYRYVDANGKPMQLEVPKEQFDEVVKLMEDKINNGLVEGVTDPNEAKNIVRKGSYTFEQVKNIAKAGNVDSLVYDAKAGAVVSLSTMGIVFTLDFATCVINGDDWKEALKNSSLNALKVGVGVEIVYIVSSQLARTNAATVFKPATDKIVNLLGQKGSKAIVDLFGDGGQAVTKAAVSEILSSNLLVDSVAIIVFTVPDVIDLFNGRISAKQLASNLAVLIVGTTGGTLGMIAGGSIGGPLGAVIGGLAGGTVSGFAADTLVTTFVKSDSEEMFEIITEQFSEVSVDFLVSEEEADAITSNLSKKLTTNILKDMYETEDRVTFANDLIAKTFEEEISKREKVITPTEEQLRNQMVANMEGLIYIH